MSSLPGVYGLPPGARRNSFSQQVLMTSGLVGYWRLNDKTGTTATDHGPYGLHGTYGASLTINQPPLFPGDPTSRSTLFPNNDSTGFVNVPHNALLNVGDGPVSVMALIDIRSGGIGYADIAGKNQTAWSFRITGAADSLQVTKQDAGVMSTSITRVPSGGALVGFTKSGSALNMYINGQNVTGSVVNYTLADTTSPMFIGRNYTNSSAAGRISDVSLWNVVLTPDQMKSFYRSLTGRGG
jgi:hypothetical protein